MVAQDHSLHETTVLNIVSTICNLSGKQDQPLFQQKQNPWNLILHYPKNTKENFLHKILCWIGLLKESDKNLQRRIVTSMFLACLIVISVDKWIYSLILYNRTSLLQTIAYLKCYLFNVLIWFAMRFKRLQLSNLLNTLKKLSSRLDFKRINVFMCVIICIPGMCSLSIAIGDTSATFSQLFYGHKIQNSYIQTTLIVAKIFLAALVYPTFTNFIALVFCTLCHQCCRLIKALTEEIKACPPKNFTILKQLKILQKESAIEDAYELLQECFSMSSFFVFSAHFFSLVSTLGYFVDTGAKNLNLSLGLKFAFYSMSSLGGMMAILYTAGGLPVELNNFKRTFCNKVQERMVLTRGMEDIRLERGPFDKPDFEFTGCGILSYKRSTMFTVIGTLLTYTVIIFNAKDWGK